MLHNNSPCDLLVMEMYHGFSLLVIKMLASFVDIKCATEVASFKVVLKCNVLDVLKVRPSHFRCFNLRKISLLLTRWQCVQK